MTAPTLEAAIQDSLSRLNSPWLDASIARDPYWPKWDSPWWHILLLGELGAADRIPRRTVERMTSAIDAYYLHTFPFSESDVPAGVDPLYQVMCHCGLGSMYRLLTDCGVPVDRALPWARPWFVRYQLADGGWNCDESAYLRTPARSSVVSTLPVLEAMLHAAPRHAPLNDEEERMLDRGAEYLIQRRLCRSLSRGGAIIDEAWLTPIFPRFYEYDVLRGLEWLQAWSDRRGRPMPEGLEAPQVGVRDFTAAAQTRIWDGTIWQRPVPSSSFPLLEAARAEAPAILAKRQTSGSPQ